MVLILASRWFWCVTSCINSRIQWIWIKCESYLYFFMKELEDCGRITIFFIPRSYSSVCYGSSLDGQKIMKISYWIGHKIAFPGKSFLDETCLSMHWNLSPSTGLNWDKQGRWTWDGRFLIHPVCPYAVQLMLYSNATQNYAMPIRPFTHY